MNKYRVKVWFKVLTVNPFVNPDLITIVETNLSNEDKAGRDAITVLALRQNDGPKPRTLAATIEKIEEEQENG